MATEPTTRASLLIRLKAPRDERAWTEFVEIYEPLIHRLARARGVEALDADDLAKDFYRASPAPSSNGISTPPGARSAAWLSRIAPTC